MNSALGLLCGVMLFVTVGYGGIVYQLSRTVFSTQFAFAEIERLDPVRAAKSTLLEYLPAEASALTDALDEALVAQRPWLVSKLRTSAVAIQDYLRGDAGRIEIWIDPTPIQEAILDSLEANATSGTTPELQLSEGGRSVDPALRGAMQNAFVRIREFRFDSEALSPDARRPLLQLRRLLGLFQVPILAPIGLVLALGIIAAIVGEARKAGVAVAAAGLVLLLPPLFSTWLFEFLPVPRGSSLPGVAIAYLPTLFDHVLAPLLPVALGALFVGATTVVLSFMVIRRRRMGSAQRLRTRYR